MQTALSNDKARCYMITVLLFEKPIAVVRTTDGIRAIAITKWLLQQTPTVDVSVDPGPDPGPYIARSSNSEEQQIFDQRTEMFAGEVSLAAILL